MKTVKTVVMGGDFVEGDNLQNFARGKEVDLTRNDETNAKNVLNAIKSGDVGRASYFVQCVNSFKQVKRDTAGNFDKVGLSNMQKALEASINAVKGAPQSDKDLALNVIKTARNYAELRLITNYSMLTYSTISDYVSLITKMTAVKKGDNEAVIGFKEDAKSDIIFIDRKEAINGVKEAVKSLYNKDADFVEYNDGVKELVEKLSKQYGKKIKEEETPLTIDEILDADLNEYIKVTNDPAKLMAIIAKLQTAVNNIEVREAQKDRDVI